jgi:hypothetical protein
MTNQPPCALCGSLDAKRIIGRTGCVCVLCMGEAAKQLLARQDQRKSPTVTASDRCLLCGDLITVGRIAATRAPYVICHHCISQAIESVTEFVPEDKFVQVDF